MSQQAQNRHFLRDNFGLALGLLVAVYGIVPAYERSIDIVLNQLSPAFTLISAPIIAILWGLCLFYFLIVGTRFIFATVINILGTMLSIIAVRLSLSRKREG